MMTLMGRKARIKSLKVERKNNAARMVAELVICIDDPGEGERDPLRDWMAEWVLSCPQLLSRVDLEGLDKIPKVDRTPEQDIRLGVLEGRAGAIVKIEQGSPSVWREGIIVSAKINPDAETPDLTLEAARCDPRMVLETYGSAASLTLKFSCAASLTGGLTVAKMGELLESPVYVDLQTTNYQPEFSFGVPASTPDPVPVYDLAIRPSRSPQFVALLPAEPELLPTPQKPKRSRGPTRNLAAEN